MLAEGLEGVEQEEAAEQQEVELPEHMKAMAGLIAKGMPSGSNLHQVFRRKMPHTAAYKEPDAAPGYDRMRKLRQEWAAEQFEIKLKEFSST